MLPERWPSEIQAIQHWERIIAAVRGSQMAKVWLEFKSNFPPELPGCQLAGQESERTYSNTRSTTARVRPLTQAQSG